MGKIESSGLNGQLMGGTCRVTKILVIINVLQRVKQIRVNLEEYSSPVDFGLLMVGLESSGRSGLGLIIA